MGFAGAGGQGLCPGRWNTDKTAPRSGRPERAGRARERRGLIPASAAGDRGATLARALPGSATSLGAGASGGGGAGSRDRGGGGGRAGGSSRGRGTAGTGLGAPAGCGWRGTSLSSSASSSASSSSSCTRNPASHGGDTERVRTYHPRPALCFTFFYFICSAALLPAGAPHPRRPAPLSLRARHGRAAEILERGTGCWELRGDAGTSAGERGETMGGNVPAHHRCPSPAPGNRSISPPSPPLLDASRLLVWKKQPGSVEKSPFSSHSGSGMCAEFEETAAHQACNDCQIDLGSKTFNKGTVHFL
ncbi:AMME syndrome candidate gene 1 protein homolog [Corvus cornix cornix]|uniref:AMME syndrome candidate gene 1 protein homolog n=1 Tax=Corvus cornix cornix TaxID=932674 RepID=UPI00194E9E18|nr:AMME syndrome candidate gene 1 protein homolog [Corvus cornix cornix]